MNKQFIYGVLFGFCLISLTAFVPEYRKYDDPNLIKKEFDNIYTFAQPKNFRFELSSPTLRDIQEGQIIFFKTNKVKFAFRKDDIIHFIEMNQL